MRSGSDMRPFIAEPAGAGRPHEADPPVLRVGDQRHVAAERDAGRREEHRLLRLLPVADDPPGDGVDRVAACQERQQLGVSMA